MQQRVSLVDWGQVSSMALEEVVEALEEDRLRMESYLDFYPEWGDSDKLACFLGFALHWVADNGPEEMALQVREGLYPILGQHYQKDELGLEDFTEGVLAVSLSPETIATMVAYCRQLDRKALEALLRKKAPDLLQYFDKYDISFLGYLRPLSPWGPL